MSLARSRERDAGLARADGLSGDRGTPSGSGAPSGGGMSGGLGVGGEGGLTTSLRDQLVALGNENRIPEAVDLLIKTAAGLQCSDVHLSPAAEVCRLAWRQAGVLSVAAELPLDIGRRIMTRLKVLAELLTYQSDLPQDGRIRGGSLALEMRVSTFPTLHGEKAVLRLFVGSGRYVRIAELGYDLPSLALLEQGLQATAGLLMVCGPAGSGKTTTIYAAVREILQTNAGQKSIVSLEDPVEVDVAGVDQSEVNPAAGLTMATGLKSLLRQDPDVILLGEIRDAETAATAFQAALTGHLVLTTFHAGSATQALSRLCGMGIEPYVIQSGLIGVICQRLIRTACDCAAWSTDARDRQGWPVVQARIARGCATCRGTGYLDRRLLAEALSPAQAELTAALAQRVDASELERIAVAAGFRPLRQRAIELLAAGDTTAAELTRCFGLPSVAVAAEAIVGLTRPGDSIPDDSVSEDLVSDDLVSGGTLLADPPTGTPCSASPGSASSPNDFGALP